VIGKTDDQSAVPVSSSSSGSLDADHRSSAEAVLCNQTVCPAAGDHNYARSVKDEKQVLSPRKKALKRVITSQRVTLHRLRKKLRSSRNCNRDKSAVSGVNRNPAVRFFESQLKHYSRNKCGRRYPNHDKNFALSLYYASPKAYKLCSKMFCLPSISLLRLWLRRVNVKPGFCDNVFSLLQRKAQSMPTSDRCCVLLLDEISLKRGLNYCKSTDEIVGFEDFGNGQRTDKYANQALVLMVRGLKSRWKQPLAYYLACNTTAANRLTVVVCEAIVRLKEIGLNVLAVICDQGATNQQMFRLFGVSADEPCVEICGNNIFFLFDPPHLLKSVRNNLVKHNFEIRGELVKWQDIVDFFEADSRQLVKLAPKLSLRHINLPPFANMRVCLAAQVFSHSVFAGIHTHVSLGAMPAEATVTANFVGDMDKLFDCCNAGSFCGPKQYRRAITDGSNHWDHMTKCKDMFASLKVVGCKVRPPCFDGWILTINAIFRLFKMLRENHDYKFLLSNRLNQDALENHFAVIRSRGGFRDNPNPLAFNATFKQVLVNHLLDVPDNSNCKDDLTTFMLQMQDVNNISMLPSTSTVPTVLAASCRIHDCDYADADSLSHDSLNSLCGGNVCEVNAVSYVAGYIAKVILQSHENCVACRELLLSSDGVCTDNPATTEVFFKFKLYEGCKKTSLHVPSATAVMLFSECRKMFVENIGKLMSGNGVFQSLFHICIEHVNKILVMQCPCATETVQKSVALFIKILLYHKVKVLNREMTSSGSVDKAGKKNRKAMKVMHK